MIVDKKLMRAYRQNPDRVRQIFETARNQSITSSKNETREDILRPYKIHPVERNLLIVNASSIGLLLLSKQLNISGVTSYMGLTLMLSCVVSAGVFRYYDFSFTNTKGHKEYCSRRQSALENLAAKRRTSSNYESSPQSQPIFLT